MRITSTLVNGCMRIYYETIPKTMRFDETEEYFFADSAEVIRKLSKPIQSSPERFNFLSFQMT